MAKLHNRELKILAARRLEAQPNPTKIILIYTLVLAALSLCSSGLTLYLDNQIGGTGGLGGLGTRAVLETIQTVLTYFSMLFNPFWSAGLLHICIAIARDQEAQPRDLLNGFKRAPRVLSYALAEFSITILICMSCVYAATYLYMLTPLSAGLSEALGTLPEAALTDATAILAALPEELLYRTGLGLCAFFLVILIPVYGYIHYSMRLGLYLVMEGQPVSAFGAVLMSNQLMKGHRLQLFRLDLSHWWYFLLESLIGVIAYLDILLPMMGIELPFDETVAYFVALVLSLLVQLGLYAWKKMQVDTTYALAYETIAHPIDPEPQT